MKMLTEQEIAGIEAIKAERDRLLALINSPELDGFIRGVHIEAVHQVEKWGEASDRAKRPADWFWLVGYLAGKALHAAVSGNIDKAKHHCISTAAALYNWHCAISGSDVRMCPGRSDVAQIVDTAFPGEAPVPIVCPNCDTALPEGCAGLFKDEGPCCALNHDAAVVITASTPAEPQAWTAGLTIKIDESIQAGTAEFRQGNEVVGRIIGIEDDQQ